MKPYDTGSIRNIAVLGHLGCGKTTLSEAILYVTSAIDKKGEVEKKTTASDYLPEEQNRLTSLSLSLVPTEYDHIKFNFIDTPGSEEFIGEINQALAVAEGAVLVVDAAKGIEVGTERLWAELSRRRIPTIIFINKLDKENVKFDELLEKLRDRFGPGAVPFSYPVGEAETYTGYVDMITMEAMLDQGKDSEITDIPADIKDRINALREQIVESVAEMSEALLEKYFEEGELSFEDIEEGLRKGIASGDITPILVGSATQNIGVRTLLDKISVFMPSPREKKTAQGRQLGKEEALERQISDDDPFSAYVFKTTVDPFIGAVNLFKVLSGTIASGKEILVANSKQTEKVNNLFTVCGKTQLTIDTLHAGDIGAVAKLDEIFTGATICDVKQPILYAPAEMPKPTLYLAIVPKHKQDEDKISGALQRLNIEDPTFEIRRNKETAQLLIGGQGMTHIGFILEKMKNMFKVDVVTEDQRVVYRETMKSATQAQGRHKKQSGGAGQFGEVWIRFEPLNPNEETFVFAEEVFGGSVPRNYFPAVEKGLNEIMEQGPLAGFPVIGLKATLYDGSYHNVDSNEISFKLAAALAFKAACETAQPTILEPIMLVKITVKDEYVGDVMGDINKRRGRVLGMEPIEGGGMQVVSADIPEAEITKYTIDLKAMTQGSGFFTRDFARYEEVPAHLIEKIVEESKREDEKK